MLLSPKHGRFGDQKEMLLNISPKTVDHTCLKDLFMLITKADQVKHMTGNKFYLLDYQDIDGGFVAFGGSSKGGKITRKGKTRTWKLDFEDVYLLLDESQVLLKIPRQNNMYSFDLKNFVPSGDLTCLFAKATIDESNLWHRRLGHINFKTMNKLVRGNLVRDKLNELHYLVQYVLLPFLTFESQNPKSSEDEIADDAGKKNGVEDPAKEDDINGLGEATNTNSTNILNTVSSVVNTVSSSFTTIDPRRARDQRNEFESVFEQDKDANSTYRMFTPVSAAKSSYENLSGSTPANAATPSNANLPDLEDTADL
ncbi:ribonuclease H-like domain-containing protein [Tanacetum coccineum]